MSLRILCVVIRRNSVTSSTIDVDRKNLSFRIGNPKENAIKTLLETTL